MYERSTLETISYMIYPTPSLTLSIPSYTLAQLQIWHMQHLLSNLSEHYLRLASFFLEIIL